MREGAEIPFTELRALIELGYASKDRALRDAAGAADTWLGKLPFLLDYLRHRKPALGPLGDSLEDLK